MSPRLKVRCADEQRIDGVPLKASRPVCGDTSAASGSAAPAGAGQAPHRAAVCSTQRAQLAAMPGSLPWGPAGLRRQLERQRLQRPGLGSLPACGRLAVGATMRDITLASGQRQQYLCYRLRSQIWFNLRKLKCVTVASACGGAPALRRRWSPRRSCLSTFDSRTSDSAAPRPTCAHAQACSGQIPPSNGLVILVPSLNLFLGCPQPPFHA